ncbi:MAG: hypothetical protein HOU81_25305 [Hamadaea sp.]|uniref:hypothetical protein n=1 Tax=Hamadaea sp. TaxID=2024425 RepID=UPI001826A7A1|nr:hypothetical protein [Hamadaea sp.]NUR74140.1 hypothetical protein [Hamadaea sp.]NUT20338.1 hypothetical protein [Hamadaea sp.]
MRKRTLLIAGVAAWALLLVGLAVYSYHRDPATVPGQTTVAQAKATMDQVTGELTAVSSSVKISEYAESPCDISNARSGRSVKRELTFTTAPGDEATLLRSIAAGLPTAYHATTTESDTTVTMYADAGNFVAVRGRKGADPGSVVVSLLSGCREGQ